MSNILRFGVPSLDELFGGEELTSSQHVEQSRYGILLPGGSRKRQLSSSISLCISGPDGTGKSVLGLHLASRYLADCAEGERKPQALPKVLYVSTDLKFTMAKKMWINFGLDYPNLRTIPFSKHEKNNKLRIRLRPCTPLGVMEEQESTFTEAKTSRQVPEGKLDGEPGSAGGESDEQAMPLASYLLRQQKASAKGELEVYFVDLASYTVGDDWGYVNRVLSLLEMPEKEQPRHLIVFDSVEGFEMLVGEHDAFGEPQTRRSRIAQVMRSAAEKCHTLLIVEEPEEGKRLPEEFVTDVVLRLRSVMLKDYVRRTLELEKVRGHTHTRGQHSYMIRSGRGSSTGKQTNPDDPYVEAISRADDEEYGRELTQSYLHVCQSLHSINRDIMRLTGKGRPANLPSHFAAFGIYYLDDMLGGQAEQVEREKGEKGDDKRGLPCSTVTALIGNTETQKSPLGTAFLSRCFTDYAMRYLELLKSPAAKLKQAGAQLTPVNKARQDRIEKRLANARIPRETESSSGFIPELGDYLELSHPNKSASDDNRNLEKLAPKVIEVARRLGPPKFEADKGNGKRDGVPVLLTTQDVHTGKLARDFLPWLLQDVPELKKLDREAFPGCLAALRIMMEEYTICRRLEIHDLPSAVLIHIVRCAVKEAQLILHKNFAREVEKRFQQSWGIRVVFDDFSILKNTYIEIRDEPLLVRFLVFYLGREGVTTLLIDTQSGRPDTTTTSQLESELRSLVDNRIYTWRFPFLSENRVAISAIPPISANAPAVTRELRVVANSDPGTTLVPLVVDPHLEFYSGIEKGDPQPIPLQIRLFEESPAFADYATQENLRYCDLFTPLARRGVGDSHRVILSTPASEYDQYRDFCYLQADTRLDHTLILQVDEFWTVRRRRVRRTSAFRPQWQYLNAALAEEQKAPEAPKEDKYAVEKWKVEVLKSGWAADAFRIFEQPNSDNPKGHRQKPENLPRIKRTRKDKRPCRADEFVWHGYHFYDERKLTEGNLKEAIDRVPYMWDFGFLLCREDPWLENKEEELSFWKLSHPRSRKFKTVGSVWEGLPKAITQSSSGKQKATTQENNKAQVNHKKEKRPSWRVFLEACYHVAKAQTYARGTPIPAFDLPVALPQSLSCLILEIWASEIYASKQGNEADEFLKHMEERELKAPEENLTDWLMQHHVELFKTWLLLIEVLDMDEWSEAINKGHLGDRTVNPSTVATRHWYKTACLATENLSYDEPIVVVGLPGYFSMRGDWFLTVAGGSHSERLASLALDMLNSRRANYERLQSGLGLPTRRIVEEEQLRTRILTAHRREEADNKESRARLRHVLYNELISLGGPLQKSEKPANPPDVEWDFHWLWRSRLKYFHRHARIWQDWVCQMILWWQYMRYVNRDEWMNGFQRYDEVEKSKTTKAKAGQDKDALSQFEKRCKSLADQLKEATPPEPHVINTLPA